MEIYITPDGQSAFEHIDPVNDASFTPSYFYYVTWVNLPSWYYSEKKGDTQ
jgi:hypothetical protein